MNDLDKDIAFEDMPDVIDTATAARYLGLATETVQAYIRDGKIRAIKCGRKYRLRRKWLNDYLDRQDG